MLPKGNDGILREFLPVFSWWASILILEMMTLIWLTGRIRVKTQTIHSEEDRIWLQDKNVILHPSGGGHSEVDHIRSAHFTDLKTIMPFLMITPIWLMTSPSIITANIILRLFPILKIIHTILYIKLIKSINTINIIPNVFLTFCYLILLFISISTSIHYVI